MLPIQSILWPTDESEASMHALTTAVELARDYKAKLYALRVISRIPTMPDMGYSTATLEPSFDVPQYEQQLITASKDTLNKTIAEHVAKDVDVSAHVEVGNPADVIVEFARQNNVGLIVMSTHGRTGISRVMVGSVTEKTIRQTSVPILTIPGRNK